MNDKFNEISLNFNFDSKCYFMNWTVRPMEPIILFVWFNFIILKRKEENLCDKKKHENPHSESDQMNPGNPQLNSLYRVESMNHFHMPIVLN